MTDGWRRGRWSFWAKAAGAALLVLLADQLFFIHRWGATVGGFALAWLIVAVTAHPEVLRDRRALLAAGAAGAAALVLLDSPDVLSWAVFWIAMGVAVLSPRAAPGDDAWRWTQRLGWQALAGLLGPLPELFRLRKVHRGPRLKLGRLLPLLALPTAGGLLFLTLFASANPLISEALARLRWPAPDAWSWARAGFAVLVLITVWAAFRPRRRRRLLGLPAESGRRLPGVTPGSVTASLLTFNALFALQNGLDIAFLWSGAGLPEGVTLAEYAHRGATALMIAALLAGLFVLVALSPGSEAARRPWVRRLVVLWVAQTMFLLASTALRTADYIEAYSLTPMRIAALAWMGLVAAGLGLICWRMLRARSTAWLVNANALAAGVVVVALSALDLNGASAAWNVRHAKEADGSGAALDVCYLRRLGPSALVPLLELEGGTRDAVFRDRLTHVRRELHAGLEARQSDWRGWTWRGARQLERADRLERRAGLRNRRPAPGERDCDGRLRPLPAPVAVSVPTATLPPTTDAAPLTSPAQP